VSFLVHLVARRQRAESSRLLLNMLPTRAHVARLMRGESVVETLTDVTLLYSDIKGFTALSSKLRAEALIRFLDALYAAFDQHLDYFGLVKVDTIGDAFIVCGAPALRRRAWGGVDGVGDWLSTRAAAGGGGGGGALRQLSPRARGGASPASPSRAAAAAAAAAAAGAGAGADVDEDAEERLPLSHAGAVALFAMDMLAEIARLRAAYGVAVELRIGLHSGRVVGGVLGKSRPRYFVWGEDTVVANLMESSGVPGQIQVSEPTALRLRREGFALEEHALIRRDAPAAPPAPDFFLGTPPPPPPPPMQTYLLRAFVAPDDTVISLPAPGQTDAFVAAAAEAAAAAAARA
jgi:class 3 adenylate cyclase